MSANLAIGNRVLTGAGFTKKGEIKFIGTTKFSTGEWVGINLDLPEGKNDGSVGDVRYFHSEPNHGLFVKRAQVKIDNEIPSASASIRERLSMAREKRSSMLRDTGTAIPKAKLSSTTSSTGSTGSGGSNSTPPPRTTRSSGISKPTSGTNAPRTPPGRAATAAPTKSKLGAPSRMTQSVNQTPAPAKSTNVTDSFATPTGAAIARGSDSSVTGLAEKEEEEEREEQEEEEVGEQEKELEEDQEEEQDEQDEQELEEGEEGEEEEEQQQQQQQQQVGEQEEEPEKQKQVEDPIDESLPQQAKSEEISDKKKHGLAADSETRPTLNSLQSSDASPLPTSAPASLSEAAVNASSDNQVDSVLPATVVPTLQQQQQEDKQEDQRGDKLEDGVKPSGSTPTPSVSSTPFNTATPEVAPTLQQTTPVPTPAAVDTTLTPPTTAATAPRTPVATASFATPAKQTPLRRFPSSRSNSMVPGGSPAGDSAAPTPSKDAALIQFMQTSIYKLNQEKDELSDKVSALNIEVQELNSHLNESNDLSTSMQEEVDRVLGEKAAVQKELEEARGEAQQARREADQEAAALRARIKNMENTPPPVDPRIGQMENEIDKLSKMIESLTMDKESLTVEQELMEEKYLQAQIDLEEALAEVQTLTSLNEAQTAAAVTQSQSAAGGADSDSQTLSAVRTENEKLREALRRLNSSAVQDKATLTTQTARLNSLEAEVEELRAFKVQAEEDLQSLRISVDSAASFEEMIEKLSEENMDLTEKLRVAQESVRDLEDTVELNEEIDAQQRKQIEADRSVIDMLNVSVAAAQQRSVEQEKTFQEQVAAASRVKTANKTLKAEISRLNSMLSSGSQESKQLEAKLKELAYLRAHQDVLASELHAVHQTQLQTSNAKHKYHALYTRMDSIFGGTAVFIEESKQINTEIAFVTAATTGLEACRGLSVVLDVILQAHPTEGMGGAALDWDLLPTLQGQLTPEGRVVPLLSKLHLLLLQAQAYTVQCNLDLFRPSQTATAAGKSGTSTVAPHTVQRLIDLKSRFEAVVQLSSRTKIVVTAIVQEWRVHATAGARSRAVIDATDEGDLDASFVSTGASGTDNDEQGGFVPSEASAAQFCQLLMEYAQVVGELTEQMSPSIENADFLDIVQNCLLLGSCNNVSPVLKMEMLYISINTLCDIGTQQIQSQLLGEDVVSHTNTSEHVLRALRSMKADVKAAVLNFKGNVSHYVDHLPELLGNFQLLLSCFDESPSAGLLLNTAAEQTEGMVKTVQKFVCKLNSAPGLHSEVSSTQQLMMGMSGTMRYFPLSLLTNAVPLSDSSLCGRLRDQFDQHIERYWMLTTQTNSDLLLQLATTSAPAKGSAGTGGAVAATADSASTYTEVSWRQRVNDSRNHIAIKFGAIGADVGDDQVVGSISGQDNIIPSASPLKGTTTTATNSKIQSLLAELDVKKDELRVAMQRCDDLQTLLDNAPTAPTASTDGCDKKATQQKKRTSRDVPELLEEISTLEEALFATEQRVEGLVLEQKALKAQISQGTSSADGSSPVSWDFAKPSGVAKKRAQGGGAVVSVSQYQSVLEQSNYWKLMVLKRLTASMVPLPSPSSSPTETQVKSTTSTSAEAEAQPKITADDMKMTFKHIELINPGGGRPNNADCMTLYHKLRLARASGVRIKPISVEADSKHNPSSATSTISSISSSSRMRGRKSNLLYKISL